MEKLPLKDENITEVDEVWRRIPNAPPDFFIKPNGVPSSSCFQLKRDEDGLSVDLARLTNFQKSILDSRRFFLYGILTGGIRNMGLEVRHDPLANNYAHSLITGDHSKSTARKLAKESYVIRP